MTGLRQAIERFKQAQRHHGLDVHDVERAEGLRQARQQLEAHADRTLRRLPFGVYPVTSERHYAVREEVELRGGRRVRGQTLCGGTSGYPPRGHPAPCADCLLVAERYLLEGGPPLELDL
ncbi:MAG: hypothetical protein KY464_09880 [Gemmatimonadetes bacterium]|nr:hypothetical protein [Gemmatimonadota bacterium]